MPFFTFYEQVANGVTYLLNGQIGRPFTGTPAQYYFDQWKTTGVYQKMNDELNKLDRMNEAREALPSALCADSRCG